MILAVTGGRNYADRERVYVEMDAERLRFADHGGIGLVVHGGATGADRLANDWAMLHSVEISVFPADWSKGPSAGPLRNSEMVNRLSLNGQMTPVVLLAFPGGRGTADCVAKAKAAGYISVREISP